MNNTLRVIEEVEMAMRLLKDCPQEMMPIDNMLNIARWNMVNRMEDRVITNLRFAVVDLVKVRNHNECRDPNKFDKHIADSQTILAKMSSGDLGAV